MLDFANTKLIGQVSRLSDLRRGERLRLRFTVGTISTTFLDTMLPHFVQLLGHR